MDAVRPLPVVAAGGIADGRSLAAALVLGAAGVNIATLHYYFATKEDLIQAVVLYLVEQFASIHDPAVPHPQPPREQLRQELLDIPYQTEYHPSVQVVLLELALRSLRDPAIREIMQGMDTHWQDYIASQLQAGVEAGLFRADLDIANAAVAYRSTVQPPKACSTPASRTRRSLSSPW